MSFYRLYTQFLYYQSSNMQNISIFKELFILTNRFRILLFKIKFKHRWKIFIYILLMIYAFPPDKIITCNNFKLTYVKITYIKLRIYLYAWSTTHMNLSLSFSRVIDVKSLQSFFSFVSNCFLAYIYYKNHAKIRIINLWRKFRRKSQFFVLYFFLISFFFFLSNHFKKNLLIHL